MRRDLLVPDDTAIGGDGEQVTIGSGTFTGVRATTLAVTIDDDTHPTTSHLQRLRDLSDRLAALPERFHLGADPSPDEPSLADRLSGGALRDWVAEDASRSGAADHQVASSMLSQHVSMVLGGAGLAGVVLFDRLVLAEPDAITVRPTAMPRWSFSCTQAEVIDVAEAGRAEALRRWTDHWLDGVFTSLIEGLRGLAPVGARMLRDNVASAAISNLVFLDWWAPERDAIGAAEILLDLGDPPVGESVTVGRITHRDRAGLCSARRSCCLMFQTEPPRWCPTCPMVDLGEREQNLRVHLGHLDERLAAAAASTD